jgi:hypothetical protein
MHNQSKIGSDRITTDALVSCFDAFSSREPVSTSLENAPARRRRFARRVGGEAGPAAALAQGFVLADEAKAFFTTVDSFSQLQDSESSRQRVVFDRSTRRFAAAEAVGVSTIGGPTG